MNLRLFASWHGVLAALVVAGLLAVRLLDRAPLFERDLDRTFLLCSGWCALLLYGVVLLYVGRKYVHKLGVSPEFKMQVDIDALERADLRLKQLRVEIAAGRVSGSKAIQQRARRILREEQVHRVVRPVVEREAPDANYTIALIPMMPLGRMAHWFRAHMYFGVAAAIVVLLHGGGGFGGTSAIVLNGLAYLVTLSGLVGLAYWVFGPAWLTRHERAAGLSTEKAHALAANLGEKVEQVRSEFPVSVHRDIDKLRGNVSDHAKAAFLGPHQTDAARDLIVLIGQQAEIAERYADLSRVRFMMNAWRFVHIPAAVLLVFFVILHVTSVTTY